MKRYGRARRIKEAGRFRTENRFTHFLKPA
jgi:hypothetical protein